MKNLSQDQLTNSLDRRIKHLMIRTLEKFEQVFPDQDDTREGQIFKGDIRTAFNDVIRAQRDELRDYEVSYRPLRVNDNNTLSITRTFMQTVQKIDMQIQDSLPSFRIYSSKENGHILEAVRLELEAGVIYEHEDALILEVAGIDDCVNSIIPVLDKYYLHDNLRAKYKEWRQNVVKLYISE